MREIVIDSDTRVYYMYEEQKYYIENKDTTTYRFTSEEAKRVLDIVAPSNTVTIEDLDLLATTNEVLTELSYTWSDTGSYLATIQLNDFSKYPLTLEPNKGKIYIMNTDLIYDLATNEGTLQRLQYIQNFYYSKLGLYVSIDDLEVIYNLLVSYYTPTPYNVIAVQEDKSVQPKYNRTIKLSNYNGGSPATYTLTLNAYNSYTDTTIGEILSLQNRVITLTEPVNTSLIHVGDTLTITNAVTYVDGYPYYANGTYTIQAISGNTITVDENFPTPYIYTPPVLNLQAYPSLIESVSRETNTIALVDKVSNSYVVGDEIQLKGTQYVTPYETLTADGTYTISAIEGNNITTEEAPPINCTNTVTTIEDVDKRTALYSSSGSESITMLPSEDLTPYTEEGTEFHFITTTNDIGTDAIYTVNNVTNNVITVNENIETSYNPLELSWYANPLEIYTIKPSSNSKYRILTTISYLGRYLMNYQVGDKIRLCNIPNYTSTASDTTFKSDERVYTIRSIRPSGALTETGSFTLAIQVEEDTIETDATFTSSTNATNPYILKALPSSYFINSVIDNKLSVADTALTLPVNTDIMEIYILFAPVDGVRKKIQTIPRIETYGFPYRVGDQVTISFPSSYTAGDGTYTIASIEYSGTYYTIEFEEPIPITGTNQLSWYNSVDSRNPYMYLTSLTTLYPDSYISLTQNSSTYADTSITAVDNTTYTLSNPIPKYLAPYIYKKKITTTQSDAYIYKRIPVADVDTIDGTTVTLSNTPSITLTNSDPISVLYPVNTEELTTIASISPSSTTITTTSTLTNFTANYGLLNKPVPNTEVLIEVEDTTKEELMPNTSFIVDNTEQCTEYLNLLTSLVTPTEACYENATQYVSNTYTLEEETPDTHIGTMTFKGLYSDIYTGE